MVAFAHTPKFTRDGIGSELCEILEDLPIEARFPYSTLKQLNCDEELLEGLKSDIKEVFGVKKIGITLDSTLNDIVGLIEKELAKTTQRAAAETAASLKNQRHR